MLNRIIRYYNQNRLRIYMMTTFIVFFIIVLQVLNHISIKKQEKERNSVISNQQSSTSSISSAEATNRVNSVNSESSKNNSNDSLAELIINQFIELCNLDKIDEAYNLIGTDCKEELFPSVDIFRSNYYNIIFSEKKTCKIEKWVGSNSTYKVKYFNDNILLDPSQYANNLYEDYITIISEQGNTKLNINSFIGKQVINKKNSHNIEIEVLQKVIFKDYEIYKINVSNQTPNVILLNTNEDSKTINLSDENNIKYEAFMNDLPVEMLTLKSGHKRILNIKFNKAFNSNRKTNKMNFEDVIIDYNKYKEEKQKENNSVFISIDL